jgi:hypothetical protein
MINNTDRYDAILSWGAVKISTELLKRMFLT